MKNQTVHRLRAGRKLSENELQLFKPKIGKTWFFIKNCRNKTNKLLSCYSKRTQRKSQTKTTGLPPVKRFPYSHIASLTYLIIKGDVAHEGA